MLRRAPIYPLGFRLGHQEKGALTVRTTTQSMSHPRGTFPQQTLKPILDRITVSGLYIYQLAKESQPSLREDSIIQV